MSGEKARPWKRRKVMGTSQGDMLPILDTETGSGGVAWMDGEGNTR